MTAGLIGGICGAAVGVVGVFVALFLWKRRRDEARWKALREQTKLQMGEYADFDSSPVTDAGTGPAANQALADAA